MFGIPSVAVSQEGGGHVSFEVGAGMRDRVASEVLVHGLPPETILNVNIPDVPCGDQGREGDLSVAPLQ